MGRQHLINLTPVGVVHEEIVVLADCEVRLANCREGVGEEGLKGDRDREVKGRAKL